MYVEPDMFGFIAMPAENDDPHSFDRNDIRFKPANEKYVDYSLTQI